MSVEMLEAYANIGTNLNWLITGREPKSLGEEQGAPPEKPLGEGDTGGEVDKLKKMKPEELRDIFHSAADRIFMNHDPEIINMFIDHAMSHQNFSHFVKLELEKRRQGGLSSKKADIAMKDTG